MKSINKKLWIENQCGYIGCIIIRGCDCENWHIIGFNHPDKNKLINTETKDIRIVNPLLSSNGIISDKSCQFEIKNTIVTKIKI